MPRDGAANNTKKKSGLPRVRSHTDAEMQLYHEQETLLPSKLRIRLHDLFLQLEQEFESLYTQNLALQEKLDIVTERLGKESTSGDRITADIDVDSSVKQLPKAKSGSGMQKVKAANKIKVQTSKIVSSFKNPTVSCRIVREYSGHRDGVWDVATSHLNQHVIATASADQTAGVWGIECGRCLLQYTGHTGSVNCVRFHPLQDFILSASGDNTAHIWQASITPDQLRTHSSEDEVECSEHEEEDFCLRSGIEGCSTLHTPSKELKGHTNVVIAADWLPGGDQAVTASWDRTANLYDVNTGEVISPLMGHDQELTYCSSHPSQRLIVTASKDTCFRLWDCRDPTQSVFVFQGHTDSVTSVSFTREDKAVSGSDDRSVKVWDVKNIQSPLATIRLDSPINRLAVSSTNVIAIPHDNRHVRLYDLSGQRIARLPRSNRQGHRRMVCGVAWADELASHTCNLFTAGFDRQVYGWAFHPLKDGKE